MLDATPPQLRAILDKIGRLAGDFGSPVYIVGGGVRDRILGRPLLDLDLAVEGDAVALARGVAPLVGADLEVHEAFGTAVLRLSGGRRVDLAGTRTESYATPAALPTVRPASLEDDLRRRDFTVNSMAVPLAEPDAAPIDPTGGLKDLEARWLRVHHDRSFVDDPTRILRGVRLEARLGFRLEPRTERLAREACAAGTVGRLSADRLRAEIELLLEERLDPRLPWQRLAELGVLAAAGLKALEGSAGILSRIHHQLAGWPDWHPTSPPVGRRRALWSALLVSARPEERAAVAARLGLEVGQSERFEELLERLERPDLAPHQAAAALEELSVEQLVTIDALGGRGATVRIAEHLRSQRGFELAIDGATLLAHGFAAGPEIGHALRATRNARLDGLITAGEELAFALAALRGENRGGESNGE